MLACASPLNQCEASPTNLRKFRRLDCGFAGCPANQRKRQVLSFALIEWTAIHLISLISASHWIGGLAGISGFFAVIDWTDFGSFDHDRTNPRSAGFQMLCVRQSTQPVRSESNEPAQIPTPGLRFRGLSSQSTQTTVRHRGTFRIMSDKPTLSDILFIRQVRRIWRGRADKAPPWVMLKPWSDSRPPTSSTTKLPPPIRAARRRSPRATARAGSPRRVSRRLTRCRNWRFRLGRGRRNSQPLAPTRASRRLSAPAPGSLCLTKFFAPIRRSPARCASVSPCEPPQPARKWRGCAKTLPGCATPNISRPSGEKPALPGAFIACGAFSPRGLSPLDERPARAADLLVCRMSTNVEGFADALRDIVAGAEHPLAAAAGASARRCNCFAARRAPTRRFSRFGWPISRWRDALAGTRRLRCSLRRSRMRPRAAAQAASAHARAMRIGSTPWPAPTRWPPERLSPWRASCRADRNRCWRRAQFAGEGRRSGRRTFAWRRCDLAGAAAKAAGLSDRAARRLFDRLVELGVARELSGRPSFRLYGL